MKHIALISCLAAMLLSPAFAISGKRLESIQKHATSSQKLIAFVVEQAYWAPNCPKCVAQVNAANRQINKIAPHKGVVVVKLEPSDMKEGDVPDIVLKAGGAPIIVVTNAECTKTIDVVAVNADKKRVTEMEEKIAAALVGAE